MERQIAGIGLADLKKSRLEMKKPRYYLRGVGFDMPARILACLHVFFFCEVCAASARLFACLRQPSYAASAYPFGLHVGAYF